MARGRKSTADRAAEQAVKDAEKRVRELRKKQREILKKQGSSIVEFRHAVSALKKAGVVSKRVNAHRQEPTRYMRNIVRQFSDVLEGRAVIAKPSKKLKAKEAREIREQFRQSGVLEVRRNKVIVPKDREGQYATLTKRGFDRETGQARGVVDTVKPMKHGREREIILPFKITSMPMLVERLKKDESLDNLKMGDEQFAFRLFGHNSQIGFPDAKEMGEYIERRYAHLFKQQSSRAAVKHLSFLSFKGHFVPPSTEHKIYTSYNNRKRRVDEKGRNTGRRRTYYEVTETEKRLLKQRMSKREQREKETMEQRLVRLEKQRARQAALRARRKREQDS
jgi:hypothetical protein